MLLRCDQSVGCHPPPQRQGPATLPSCSQLLCRKVTAWTVLLCSTRTVGDTQQCPGKRQQDLGVSTWRTEEMWVSSRKGCCNEIQSEAPTELLPSKIKGSRPRQAHPPTHIPTAITKCYASLPGGYLLTSRLGEKQ